ncbi:GAF domain-containing protein [Gordonia sputi]
MSWHVVETLSKGRASIVWSDGKRAEWRSLMRLQQDLGLDLQSAVNETRQSTVGIDRLETTAGGDHRRLITLAHPNVDGYVHAVSVWVGEPGAAPSEAPIIGPTTLDVGNNYAVHHCMETYMMSSVDPSGFGADRDPTMYLYKVISFDHVHELVELAASPGTRTEFRGELNVRHDDGHIMHWQSVARYNADENVIRGFGQDITAYEPPVINPSDIARMGISGGSATVLIGFPADGKSAPVPHYWLTPPPAALSSLDPNNAYEIHPDDTESVWRVQRILSGSVTATPALPVSVRMKSSTSVDWVACDMLCSKYPSENIGAFILVCQVQVPS